MERTANWVRGKREKRGLALERVDEILRLPPGTAARAEQPGGLIAIRVKDLAALAHAYEISDLELIEALPPFTEGPFQH